LIDGTNGTNATPGLARALGAPLDPLERATSAVVRVIDGAFDTRIARGDRRGSGAVCGG
jgi:hypothetical protein